MFDRGRAQQGPSLIPAPYAKGERFKGFTRYGEWWRSPDGVWTPTVRGGAGGTYISGAYELPRFSLWPAIQTATQSTIALDSNYVYNTSGDALGARLILPVAETLNEVRFFIASFTGTAANVNDINLELRDSSLTVGPGSTLIESKTFDPASTTRWNSSTGWTSALTANTIYWIVIGDADGGVTDFATVADRTGTWVVQHDYQHYNDVTTTDGWSSVRTFQNRAPSTVLLFSSGRVIGNPLTAVAASTSSTNQRGLRFIAPAACKVFGAISGTAGAAGLSGINLWSGSGGPGGSADANGTTAFPQAVIGATDLGFMFETYPTLTQGTTYRLVFTYSAAATTPSRLQIGTGADATLRSAMLGGGNWYWAEANGTTDWSNDNTSEFPAVGVIVEDFVTASAGGGGGFPGIVS